MKTTACLLVLIALMSSAVAAQPTDDLLIVAGERIGPLKIGMSITEATRILGTPKPANTKLVSIVLPVPEGALAFRWDPSTDAKKQGAEFQGFELITDRTGMVYEVQSPFDNRYHTADGLRVGSKAGEVTAALGAPSRQSAGGHERYLVYDQRGIAFLVQDNRQSSNYDLVNGVWVFGGRTAP